MSIPGGFARRNTKALSGFPPARRCPMQVQPYLFFDGRCEEAVTFYRDALGAQVLALMHYSDAPQGEAGCPGGQPPPADKVMHAALQIGQTLVMASDGFANGRPEFKGVS